MYSGWISRAWCLFLYSTFLTGLTITAVPDANISLTSPFYISFSTYSIIMILSSTSIPLWRKSCWIKIKITIIESLVIPGRTRSSNSGVRTFLFPVVLSFKTKNIFELPISPTFPFQSQRTCWWPLLCASLPTAIVGP